MMRGIIADCRFYGNNNSICVSSGIDPFRLRQYLLYWDKIDYPSNNILYIELTPEEKFLEEIGVLKRSHFTIKPDKNGIIINPQLFVDCQINALEANSKNRNEIWSLGQNNIQIEYPEIQSVKSSILQLELYDCIPVPSEDTAFDDILNFKERRKDELMAFRKVLENMCDEILESEYFELKKKRKVEELQNKIIDINRVMNESGIKRFLSSMNVELNVLDIVKNVVIGYEEGDKIGFPTAGAALGLVSSALNITSKVSLKSNRIPEGLKDYAYLFYAKREIL